MSQLFIHQQLFMVHHFSNFEDAYDTLNKNKGALKVTNPESYRKLGKN